MLSEKATREISLFLILFLSSSYTICNDLWSSAVTIALWCVVPALLLLRSHLIRRGPFFAGIILIVCLGISTVVNSENIRTYMILVFSYLVLILFVSQVDFQDFVDSYQNIMKILCKISLIGYVLFLLVPGLHNVLSIINSAGSRATNLILYVASKHHLRNMGMFWEPGAFQSFVNLGLLFEISKRQTDKKTVLLYIVTILTTYSTTGYIGMLLILMIPFFKREGNVKKKLLLLVGVFAVIVICYFTPAINNLLFASSIKGQSTVFGKILNFFSGSSNSTVLSSADVRYNAVFEVWNAFTERPLFGYGYSGLAERTYLYTHGMNTCTFLNWFASYGFLYGAVAIVGIILFSRKISSGAICITLTVAILFALTMSENYIQHASIILLIIYGYTSMRKQPLSSDLGEERK